MSSGVMPLSTPALMCVLTIVVTDGTAALCASMPRASAARPWTSGSGSLNAPINAGAGRGVADQAHRERRHLLHLGIGLRLQDRRERGNGLGQLHAAQRQRGAPPDARLGVRQQHGQVAAAGPHLALVLELKNPAHLLREHHRRRIDLDRRRRA